MKAARLFERGRAGVPGGGNGQSRTGPDAWVLLRPLAGSINRVDLYMRDNGAGITHELPQTLGLDAVGEVIESDPGLQLPPRAIGLSFIPMSSAAAAGTALRGDQPLCLDISIFGEQRGRHLHRGPGGPGSLSPSTLTGGRSASGGNARRRPT